MPLKPSQLDSSNKQLRHYLNRRFPRSLLILGDLTAPLRDLTEFWAVNDAVGNISGVAAFFHGFDIPVVPVIADDTDSACSLANLFREKARRQLRFAMHVDEPYATTLATAACQTDIWMHRETAPFTDSIGAVKLDSNNTEELDAFYAQQDIQYWTAAMMNFNHSFGIRWSGSLVSSAGVNFVLHEHSYAQIGSIITDLPYRGKGFATACIQAVIDSLYWEGITYCGLFAESTDTSLLNFYFRLGFRIADRFHFFKC